MAGYSSRSDQLWYFALQLAEEETKSIPSAQQEHGQRIQAKYNQLVSNLSCLGVIIATMFEKEKLTLKEFEQIRNLQSTPIRANEELLSIIAVKPRDVYECFLSLTKDTNQLHLYQMLVCGNETFDKEKREDASDHKVLICRNFVWLSEKLDTENGLISLLFQKNVLTVREKESVLCISNIFQKNELLLGLLSKKSLQDFHKFLQTLDVSGQGHIAKILRKPEGSTGDLVTVQSAVYTPKSVCQKLLPKEINKSRGKPDPVRNFSKPVPPPKTFPKSGQKPFPSRPTSKPAPPPKPGTQSTSAKHHIKSMHTVAKTTGQTSNFRRIEWVKFQARLEGLESRLQTDIAIKVAYVSLIYFDKPEDSLKICFHTLLQEWKKLVARNVETNMELDQLRISARQNSAASSLNEVLRMQLQSMQKEMASERFQSSEKRMQLEEKIDKLKTDIRNEKSKCKRFEEEILRKNAIIVEIEDRLKKAECDKLCYLQQVHEINNSMATADLELPKSKENLEDSNEVILLRTEIERLKKACEVLSKGSEIRKEIEVQVLHTQKNNQDSLTQPQDKEESFEREYNATAQLEQLNHKPEGRIITFVTQESYALINNHQFFVENINSNLLINLLHEKNCITDEDRGHLRNQPDNFYRNDALLYWMRTIPFKEYEGQKVLECFRQTKQTFFVELLKKGGVLIKSMILSKLVKEGLFAKSPIKNVEELKEKEAMVIKKLNQTTKWYFSSAEHAISDLANRDIFIVPYCHQEAGGIVIWFWCRSKDGQKELQNIYKSGILLEKLITFFKQFSNDGLSSALKLLVPTSIIIFEGDFTKDKITSLHLAQDYYYRRNPEQRRVNHADITGLAVLGREVFISRHRCPDIEVYDSTIFRFKRRMEVEGMTIPEHIVSCSVNKCLYAFDWDYQGELHAILRIDQTNGTLIKTWTIYVGLRGGRISIASDTNVILCIGSEDKLHEYTADGELIRIINLCHSSNIIKAWHAVKLNNGLFVVCYSDCEYNLGKVYLLSTKATTPAPERIDKVKILATFGDMIDDPRSILYLSVDTKGSILVFDDANEQAVLLSSNLDKPQILVSAEHGMELPWRTCFDEATGQWFLADHHRVMVCRVTDEQVTRKCYDIISQ